MQAFGLLVVDFDGAKLSQLASDLTTQGYAVASVSVSASDPPAAAPMSTDFPGQSAGRGDTITVAPAADEAAPAAAVEEPAAASASEPDNSQPFKCPACGATYADQVVCTNQHEPTQTVATEDVLAGATAESSAGGAPSAAGDVTPAPSPPPAEPAAENGGDAPGASGGPTAPDWPS